MSEKATKSNAATPSDKENRESYGEQLTRLTKAMCFNDKQTVLADCEEGFGRVHVDLMVDGSLDKRFDMVKMQLELIAEHMENFDELCSEFILDVPNDALSNNTDDGESMLVWLEKNKTLTPEEKDLVACQRARHAVYFAAWGCRGAHIRFAELASLSETLSKELSANPNLMIHLNPLRFVTRFETKILLDKDDTPPTDVLFFALGRDIRSAVLEPNSLLLVEELSEMGPTTLDEWALVSQYADREELLAFCTDTAEMQLVAFS